MGREFDVLAPRGVRSYVGPSSSGFEPGEKTRFDIYALSSTLWGRLLHCSSFLGVSSWHVWVLLGERVQREGALAAIVIKVYGALGHSIL